MRSSSQPCSRPVNPPAPTTRDTGGFETEVTVIPPLFSVSREDGRSHHPFHVRVSIRPPRPFRFKRVRVRMGVSSPGVPSSSPISLTHSTMYRYPRWEDLERCSVCVRWLSPQYYTRGPVGSDVSFVLVGPTPGSCPVV